jgi:hypothetical protein
MVHGGSRSGAAIALACLRISLRVFHPSRPSHRPNRQELCTGNNVDEIMNKVRRIPLGAPLTSSRLFDWVEVVRQHDRRPAGTTYQTILSKTVARGLTLRTIR